MNRCIPLLALACILAPRAAAADPATAFRVEAPESFAALPGLSEKLATTASQSRHFDVEEVSVAARAFGRAGLGALYVTSLEADAPSPDPEAAIRAALDRVREAPAAASPQAGSTTEVAYEESVADRVAEATHEWHHMSNETIALTRALAWANEDGAVRLVKAECVYPSDADSRGGCERALASLTLTGDAADRRELGELGASRPPRAAEPAGIEALEAAAAEGQPTTSEGPSLRPAPSEGGRVLYQGPEGEAGGGGERPGLGWIVLGAVLIAGAFWWTTKSRTAPARGEAADADASGGAAADDASDAGPDEEPKT